jgi:hypothetical protein
LRAIDAPHVDAAVANGEHAVSRGVERGMSRATESADEDEVVGRCPARHVW